MDEMKESLIKILKDICPPLGPGEDPPDEEEYEALADVLLAHGVIVKCRIEKRRDKQ